LPAGEAAEAYAKTIIAADFEEPGDDDVIRKLRADFAEKQVTLTDAELRDALARASEEARRQLSVS
jgi:hypothetical protein